jgi:hypothetical protein
LIVSGIIFIIAAIFENSANIEFFKGTTTTLTKKDKKSKSDKKPDKEVKKS